LAGATVADGAAALAAGVAAASVATRGGVALPTVPVSAVAPVARLATRTVEAAVRSTLPKGELFTASAMSVLLGLAVGASVVIQVPLLAVVIVAAAPALSSSAAAGVRGS